MSDIVLSAGVRSNLLQLQLTSDLITQTQNKLATGKKVAPRAIETALVASPLIAQAVVVGDDGGAVGVLIVPIGTVDEAQLHHEVERLTAELAAYERPRRVAVLPRRLTVADGELSGDATPRRETVLAHFPEQIASLSDSR